VTQKNNARPEVAASPRVLTSAELEAVAGGDGSQGHAYPPIQAADGITNANSQTANTPANGLMPVDFPYSGL
jgi:hypothetical protein